MPAVISSLTTEYVLVPVAAKASGATVNPTGDTVELAFMRGSDEPESGDWHTGSWETDTTTTPDTYSARVLVGPAAVALKPGAYAVWVRVTDSPEIVVRNTGALKVT